MREPNCCIEVRKWLARHGMPGSRIDRATCELAEHWEDLHTAALQDGMPPAEASAHADARLGNPQKLAAELVAGLRRSLWLGRHPLVAVCVLPLLLPPLLMVAVALPLYWLGELTPFAGGLNTQFIVGALWLIYYAALITTVMWLCWRSWAAGLGTRWIVAICSWCALTALLRFFDASAVKHKLVIGLSYPWKLNTHTATVLLLHALVAGIFLFAAWRNGRRTFVVGNATKS